MGIIYSENFELPNSSEGIIFFKQSYNSLYYSDFKSFPRLSHVDIQLGRIQDSVGYPDNEDLQVYAVVRVKYNSIEVIIKDALIGSILADEGEYFLPSQNSGDDPLDIARKIVEKKINVKVDGANNRLTVIIGDLVNIQEIESKAELQSKSLSALKYLEVPLSREV